MLIIHNPIKYLVPQNPRSTIPLLYAMSSSSSSTKIVADYAKSGRSSCKKCEKTIDKSSLRLGLSFKDPRGFGNTKWHHLNCFPLKSNSLSSPDSITGFSLLRSSDQETLKKLVSSGNQSPGKSDKAEEAELEERDLKIEKIDRCYDPASGHLLSVHLTSKILECTDKTDEDVETESEERDSKKIKISDAPVVFAIKDIKDKYIDAELLPKWKAFQTIIYLERDDGLQDSTKIAAFDFDGCLVKTSVRRVGANAWSLMYPSIPEKLQSLYNDGYKLVIFTNESNINRWKNKRQVAVDSKIGRLDSFIELVKVPVQVFIACGVNSGQQEDPFRKPKPGMWHIMEQQFNSGIPIDMDQSFYVGDAAGRKDDHSDADIKFAQAIGLKFHLPEEYFIA